MAWHVVPDRRRSKAARRGSSCPSAASRIGSASTADLSLGYRRIETAGPWIVRKATGKGGNWIKNFATADDFEESNGDSVLTFFEAQAIARTIARDGEASGGLITVATAIDRYARDLATRGGRAYNARARPHPLAAGVARQAGRPAHRPRLKDLRDGLLKGRTAGTVNRTISVLRAALELAAATDPRITNTAAFKVGLKKLPDAARARNVVLTDAQVRQCGRAGLRGKPRVRALDRDPGHDRGAPVAGGAADGRRSAGRPRPAADDAVVAQGQGRKRIDRKPVPIPASLAATLQQAAGDRSGDALLLLKPDGSAWGASDLRASVPPRGRKSRPRSSTSSPPTACGTAASPGSYCVASRLRVVAASHDTSVPMIEKRYSATIGDHSDALYRNALLDLGGGRDDKGGDAGPEGLTVVDKWPAG